MTQQNEPTVAVGSASAAHAARGAKGGEEVVILSAEQYAARALARELAEMREQGIKLDETVPGGKYGTAGAPGHFHDAHGQVFNAKVAKETAEAVGRLGSAPTQGGQILSPSAGGIEAGREGFADSAGNVAGGTVTDGEVRGVQKKPSRKSARKTSKE